MAVVNQLNLNVGTEQNPNFVLHDIHDKRISTTAVTTATHLLTCNSGVTSIAPITTANLASVLGGVVETLPQNSDLNNLKTRGKKYVSPSGAYSSTMSNLPTSQSASAGFELMYFSGYSNTTYGCQLFFNHLGTYVRYQNLDSGTRFSEWKMFVVESSCQSPNGI